MEKQDIINYVLTTPENTNPAILGGMLEQLIAESEAGGGGGGESGDVKVANITLTTTEGDTFGLYVDQEEDNISGLYGYRCIFKYVGDIELFTTNPTVKANKGVPSADMQVQVFYTGDSVTVMYENTITDSSGDVTINTDTSEVTISGDCTLAGYYSE